VLTHAALALDGTPVRWLLEWIRKLLLRTHLKTYFRLQPVDGRHFAAWRAIMAAGFLADVSLPEEEGNLMAILESGLGSL